MKKKKTLLDNIVNSMLVILLFTTPIILLIINLNLQKEINNWQKTYYKQEVYYEKEFAEIETGVEMREEYYDLLIDLAKAEVTNEFLSGIIAATKNIYIKTEDDGDFELYWYGQNGWEYVQVLGGEEVERQAYGHIDEQFIINLLGARISEFRKI